MAAAQSVWILHWNDLKMLRKSNIFRPRPARANLLSALFEISSSSLFPTVDVFLCAICFTARVVYTEQYTMQYSLCLPRNYPQLWINWFGYVNRKAQQISTIQTITNQMHIAHEFYVHQAGTSHRKPTREYGMKQWEKNWMKRMSERIR